MRLGDVAGAAPVGFQIEDLEAGRTGGPGGCFRVLASGEQEFRRAIGEQIAQLAGRHAPVQRGQDGAQLGAGEQGFEEFDPVAAQDSDPVARTDAAIGQNPCGPGAAIIEGGIGHGLTGLDHVEGGAVRCQRGAAGRNVGENVHQPAASRGARKAAMRDRVSGRTSSWRKAARSRSRQSARASGPRRASSRRRLVAVTAGS